MGDRDRHQPTPSLLALPGHLLRALPTGQRRAAVAALVVLGLGIVTAAAVLAPRISETKEAARQREAASKRASLRAEAARLRREQQARTGRAPGPGQAALDTSVERAIVTDVARRRAGGQRLTPARRARCRTVRRSRRTLFACTAVTSIVPRVAESGAGYVGYPYRAMGDVRTGHFAVCKVAGRPGEGSFYSRTFIRLPAACGG